MIVSQTTLNHLRRNPVVSFVVMGWNTFFSNHGTLAAKGIAFSLLMTSVPILFVALYVASLILADTSIINTIFHKYLNDVLPVQVSEMLFTHTMSIVSSDSWQNIGILGIFILIITPQNLYSAIEMGLKSMMNPPRQHTFFLRHLFFFLAHFLVIVIIYAFAFIAMTFASLPDRLFALIPASLSGLRVTLMVLSSRMVGTAILTLTFASMYRISYHGPLRKRFLFGVSLVIAIIWQTINRLGTSIVSASGRREVVYGILAGAVMLMVWAYLFSTLLLIGGIAIAQFEKLYTIRRSFSSTQSRRWRMYQRRR